MPSHRRTACTLITGATGFLGQWTVARLIEQGQRCVLLVRGSQDQAEQRMAQLLAFQGIELGPVLASGQISIVTGDLDDAFPHDRLTPLGVTCVLHIAAATRFDAGVDGEPMRTNVAGTCRLLDWCDAADIERFIYVSSAYVCGRSHGVVDECFDPQPPDFHNVYEQSKWQAEQLCEQWRKAAFGRMLTIARPSIIVGQFEDGMSTRFSGVYLSFRATELLHRMHADASDEERMAIDLRIKGRATDRQNLVPVDYVGDALAALITHPHMQGRTFHLVNPVPPSNLLIKRALETYFKIAGGTFVAPERFDHLALNEHEQRFYDVSRAIEHYFIDTPRFARRNASLLDCEAGLRCPTYDLDAIVRLIDFACRSGWGRRMDQSLAAPALRMSGISKPSHAQALPPRRSLCAEYFERFLPERIPHSSVARMNRLVASVRFTIEDEPNGSWLLRFADGDVESVQRGAWDETEDFGYRTSRKIFEAAIAGGTTPQQVFLSGQAEMHGNIEQALKMAMILNAFTREYPFNKSTAAIPATKQSPRMAGGAA